MEIDICKGEEESTVKLQKEASKQAWQTSGKDDEESRSDDDDELTNPNFGDIVVGEGHQNRANDTREDGRLGLVFLANSRVRTRRKSCLEMGDRLDVPDIKAFKRESGVIIFNNSKFSPINYALSKPCEVISIKKVFERIKVGIMGCGPNLRINSTSKWVALNRVVVQPRLIIKDNQGGENNYWVRGPSLFTKGEIFSVDYFPSQKTASNTGNRKRILRHDDIEETNKDFIMIKNFDPLAAKSCHCECK
ncbi:hypothetical protein LguiA_030981 [Lonicera macranthoides]